MRVKKSQTSEKLLASGRHGSVLATIQTEPSDLFPLFLPKSTKGIVHGKILRIVGTHPRAKPAKLNIRGFGFEP